MFYVIFFKNSVHGTLYYFDVFVSRPGAEL